MIEQCMIRRRSCPRCGVTETVVDRKGIIWCGKCWHAFGFLAGEGIGEDIMMEPNEMVKSTGKTYDNLPKTKEKNHL